MTRWLNRAEPKNPHSFFHDCILLYKQISWQITQDRSLGVLCTQFIHDLLLILQAGWLG